MEYVLSEADKRLLEELQQDFPLVSRPFKAIGVRCGLGEAETLMKVAYFLEMDLIRDISTLLYAGNVGYHSTLVAVHAPEELVEETALRISAHPGVSHNYLRENYFNIWFTLSLPEDMDFQDEVADMLKGFSGVLFRVMPALRTFKIGVNFKLTGGLKSDSISRGSLPSAGMTLSGFDRQILSRLQDNLEVIADPWAPVAGSLGMDTESLFKKIEAYKRGGIVKRISAVLRHRRVGFRFNGMACFYIPSRQILEAGEKAALFPEVTHCYERTAYPDWKYTLFAMVHGESEEECRQIIGRIASAIGCEDYRILFSRREFKKERVKYFRELYSPVG